METEPKKDWRVHLGPVSAVLWGTAMLLAAVPVSAQVAPTGTLDGFRVSWPQLLFIGATGAWAGRVNARLDSIEKAVDKKQDRSEARDRKGD